MDLGDRDGACRNPRTDGFEHDQYRHHATSLAVAGGHSCRAGWSAQRVDRYHDAGRDRPADRGVQPDGRAITPQRAGPRNLRQIYRPANRGMAYRSSRTEWRRGQSPRDDYAVLRYDG